jgi:hypothetical protein
MATKLGELQIEHDLCAQRLEDAMRSARQPSITIGLDAMGLQSPAQFQIPATPRANNLRRLSVASSGGFRLRFAV